jgi:hypothetical protein
MISSQYDLFGSWLRTPSSPAFHAKKNSDGTTIAIARDETRAGIAVIAGKGVRTVGTLEMSSPTEAGINSPQPTASVVIPIFKSALVPQVRVRSLDANLG